MLSVLQLPENNQAKRQLSLARVLGIAITFSGIAFGLSRYYGKPLIFWGGFIGINVIVAAFVVTDFLIRKHAEQIRFCLPALFWIYGVTELFLLLWEVIFKNH